MSIPLFFAMTGQEMHKNPSLPDKIAWMSCHFSAGGTALADVPQALPQGSMLILDDRIPFQNHDTTMICAQLRDLVGRLECSHVLLDFEREPSEILRETVAKLVKQLPCPVGMPVAYARDLDCPVFLPPVPPQVMTEEYLRPFQNREIWLETALDGALATITKEGCGFTPVPFPEPKSTSHYSSELHCHYHIEADSEQARFSFYRTWGDVSALLEQAGGLGVTLAVGLYQELWQS